MMATEVRAALYFEQASPATLVLVALRIALSKVGTGERISKSGTSSVLNKYLMSRDMHEEMNKTCTS